MSFFVFMRLITHSDHTTLFQRPFDVRKVRVTLNRRHERCYAYDNSQ